VNYSATVLPGANWLVATGSGTAMASNPGTVSFSVNPTAAAALPVGAQYATIQVVGAGVVNSPLDFQVILNVTPATTSVVPDPEPAGLIFIDRAGTPSPQIVTLFASSATAIPFQASANAIALLSGKFDILPKLNLEKYELLRLYGFEVLCVLLSRRIYREALRAIKTAVVAIATTSTNPTPMKIHHPSTVRA
jgi:hypothetical protein